MLKWQDGSSGESAGGEGGGRGGTDSSSVSNSNQQQNGKVNSSSQQKSGNWQKRSCNHPVSPQMSLSSHDDGDQDINSNQSLLVSNRERNKLCKSSSALCSLLGRLSRSRPEIGLNSVCNTSSNGLFPSSGLYSSGALYSSSSALSSTALASTMLSTTMRKCQTLVSLSSPESPPRPLPIHPYNRLRPQNNATALLCSRCSSLLSMASSSKYSVNEGRYVSLVDSSPSPVPTILCKLCLVQIPSSMTYTLQCSCSFCSECTRAYVEFEIDQGAYEISCPDAMCKSQGIISLREIENLVSRDMFEKHLRFRKNKEVDSDTGLAWCPGAGCETVCTVLTPGGPASCPTCSLRFCSVCRSETHGEAPCPRLSGPPPPLLAFDSDLIKCCPMCSVPIEKDEGCAQMMCKRCKHVFCWYCLTSLDDDFLLRHYDKGPCKNKLGHSRASVIWHRTQVIGIFAGFGLLLLVASPLLLLAAPCIVCCKCRVCTGSESRIEDDAFSASTIQEENSRETS